MANVVDILRERGFLDSMTDPGLPRFLDKTASVYAGFDPTSESLQLGNLVAVFGLAHFQRCGHKVIAIVGGATGLIGDPSGKTSERTMLSESEIERNQTGVRENLSRILDFKHPTTPAKLVNNADWMRNLSFIDFIRDVGRHFRVGSMLNKESVRARLDSESGMNFAEFSYQVLQSYDFLHLYNTEGCLVQVGGSDQWGNITAGIELIRKLRGVQAYGLTFPLVCDSSGAKFGKSEGNALYLDSRQTSCYRFYQFFIRTADSDAGRYLRLFTFLDNSEIADLEEQTRQSPEKRIAQQKLAEEVTRIVHGEDGLAAAKRASQVLFGGSMDGLPAEDLLDIFVDVPSSELAGDLVLGRPFADVATAAGMTASKGEARRLIQGGGLYVNNGRVSDSGAMVREQDIIDGRVLVLRSGKKNFCLVKVISDPGA